MDTIIYLASYLKPYRLWLILCAFASIATAFTDVIVGIVARELVDSTVIKDGLFSSKYFLQVIIVLLVGIAAKFVAQYAAGYYSLHAVRDIRNKVSLHVSEFSVSKIEDRHSGDRLSRIISDVSAVEGLLNNTFTNIIYMPIVFIVTFLYMLTVNWKLLLVSFAFIPILILLANKLSKPIKEDTKHQRECDAKAVEVAQDAISGVVMEKSYGLSNVLFNKYSKIIDKRMHYSLKSQKLQANLTPLWVMIHVVPYISCLAYGGYLGINGHITLGSLMSFILLLNYLIFPLAELPHIINAIRSGGASVDRIKEVLDESTEPTSGDSFAASEEDAVIEFNDVSFSYNEDDILLKGVSFTLEKGKTIALVGQSGNGKSTIIKLLCGFYSNQSGSIKVYGKDLCEWNKKEVRIQFSVVTQESFLYPSSIMENVLYGKPDATNDEVVDACKMANAHDFIMEMPEGYDTFIGERGVRLSGGQKQRLAIARAFLRNAPVLLLDEPTSALDNQSEALVRDSLDTLMRGKTVLIIAHRLSTINNVDQILVLDNGEIVENGTHEQLINVNGVYKKLYEKQLEGNTVLNL